MTAPYRYLLALAAAAPALLGAAPAFAASSTALANFEGVTVRTDGTASVSFTGVELLEAFGVTTGGVADPLNDGVTFSGALSPDGEALATNSGRFGASSFAAASGFVLSNAVTFLDAEMLLSGTGTVYLDIAYSLAVDTFDNLASAFAIAGLNVSTSFASDALELTAAGAPGLGEGDALSGLLTLSFFVDVDPLTAAFSDTLFINTYASAQAAPVPVPAAVWLFGSALAGVAALRRRVVATA